MWFKNLRAYRLTYDTGLTPDALESALADAVFSPCGKVDLARAGFVAPLGDAGTMLTHTVAQTTMLCLRRQEKVLPPAAIAEQVSERVAALEAREGRPAQRRERTALKDEVTLDLLPRALTRSERIYAYIDFQRKFLLIDSASERKAELVLEHLRAALGTLPVVPLDCHGDTASIMTRWVTNRPEAGFELDQEVELTNSREARNVVRCRYQDIDSREVLGHIEAGKRVTRLALTWREAIRFVLSEDFVLRRLRFDAKITDHGDGEADDVAGSFDQDFAVMAVQLGALLDSLLEGYGGMEKL
ncbi:MAG: recombination-associated protein RdgC [Pseudomonadota bacterium]